MIINDYESKDDGLARHSKKPKNGSHNTKLVFF